MNVQSLRMCSLKARMTLSTLVIFLGCMWGLSYYASTMLLRDVMRTSSQQQFSSVSLLANQIDGELNERLQVLKSIAHEITPTVFEKNATLQAFLEQRPQLQYLFNGGVLVTSADGTAIADLPLSAGRIGINYIDRTFVSTPLREGIAVVGVPVVGKKLGVPIFSISAPIQDANGKVTGVLLGTINLGLPNFLDRIMSSPYGKSGGYLLVSRDARLVVAATDKRRVLQRAGITPMSTRYIDGYEGSDVFVNGMGVEVLASVKGIPVANWYLASSLPTSEAFAPVQGLQQRMLWATFVLSLLACSLTWWWLWLQLRPLTTAIETITHQSQSEELPQPLEITTQDEIGALFGGFNGLIASLNKKERALRESESRFRAMADSAPVLIWISGQDKLRNWFNEVWLRFSGRSMEQEMGNGWAEGVHPDDSNRCLQTYVRAFEAQQEFTMEYRLRRFDGEYRWLLDTGVPRFVADGTFTGYIGSCIDITDRKKLEAEQGEDQQILRSIMNTTLDGFLHLDADGRVLDVNSQYCHLSGYTREELIGVKVNDLNVIETDEKAAEHFRHIIEQGPQQFESVHRRKDGTLWSVEVSVSYRKIAGGQFLAFLRNITERKNSDERVQQALASAKLANSSKSRFLAAASHDLRQPMAALALYTSLLGSAVKPGQEKLVSHMQSCVDSLSAMLNDLLDMSKLDAGAMVPTISDFSVDGLCASLQTIYDSKAEKKGLRLRCRHGANLTLRTDQRMLYRLIGNLIDNAVAYTAQGGVLVATRRHGGKLWLEVWDTGVGMAQDQIPLIFEEFRQLGDNARNRGSGLGLSIATKLAALLGLEIRVRSRLGRGSVFSVTLPEGGTLVPDQPPALESSPTFTIAVVEDNLVVLDALVLGLQGLGHTVFAGTNGAELLKQLDKKVPDVVISDYRLGAGETGLDVIAAVRARFGPQLPAIILTGDTDPDLQHSFDKDVAVLYKPTQLGALQEALMQVTRTMVSMG